MVQRHFPSAGSLWVLLSFKAHQRVCFELRVADCCCVCGRALGSVTEMTFLSTGITGILWPGVLRRSEQADLEFLLKFCELSLTQAVMGSS